MGLSKKGRFMAAAAAGACALAAAPAAQASHITVDDDGAQCPGAPFTSIQAAVNAAAVTTPPQQVAVCAGTYTEGTAVAGNSALTINKSINIRGVGADQVFIQPAGNIAEAGSNPPLRDQKGNIVSIGAGANVNISGVTVRGNDRNVETGVNFLDASGSVTNSRITDLVQTVGPGTFGATQRGIGVVAFGTTGTTTRDILLANDEIDAYNKGGVLFSSLLADFSGNSGSRVNGTIRDSRIQGGGEFYNFTTMDPQIAQNGVQVDNGASLQMTGSTVSDNRFKRDVETGAVVLLNAALGTALAPLTSINGNNIQNNSFGLENLDGNGADRPATDTVDARGNWWGNPSGPTCDSEIGSNATPNTNDTPSKGDYINCVAVTAEEPTNFLVKPRSQAPAPGVPGDAQPLVKITSPADGAVLPQNQAATVTADGTGTADDVSIEEIVFRRGTTIIGSDKTRPYQATFTPTTAQAGQSSAITATARDNKGQTATDAISVKVADNPGGTPAAEDRPPTLTFTAPAENAVLPTDKATNVTFNAADDRGVTGVALLDDGQVVGTDTTAPYSIAYTPQGDDVGRNTLVAIAADTTGQTAAAIRNVTVGRFVPQALSAQVSPTRDRVSPYRFRTSGKLTLPAGVSQAQGCGTGLVSVQFKRGANTISTRRITLSKTCTYASTVSFNDRKRLGKTGRLNVVVRYAGNAVLGRVTAPKRAARAG